MARVIGKADDFYRLRVMHVDESDGPDLDWRDDILYRRPPRQSVDEYELFRVEAVLIDDEEALTTVGSFRTQEEAYAFIHTVEEDLAEMTKSEFEDTYFTAK
ncbi:MAG: hypothetical protein JXE06_03000 [Coriobacteriia bacterium]|nr:hypothetical protein [Coriobacteriia bacterium]MBN2821832.1 hypothetical protein [Coriobacteriia bacterium]